MTDFRTQQMQDGDLARRALERLTYEESQREAAEKVEAQAREEQGWAQWHAQLGSAEAEAVSRMQALAAKYAEREAAAEKAIAALAEFYGIESSIRAELDAIGAGLNSFWVRIEPMQQPARWAGLREQAGLKDSHKEMGLSPHTQAEKVGATAVKAIVGNVVKAGAVMVGGKAVTYDFEN